ncbi:MAG: D-2-hydroxyacid dehydrogenase [Betaproteobacteria bacterium]
MSTDNISTHVRILLSQDAIERFGEEIEMRLLAQPHELVALESVGSAGEANIDIAFLTKDISGHSTKTVLSEPLAKFFALLRSSNSLKWVHTHSAGADRPIYPELIAKGARVSTSSGLTADTVAQSAVAGLLSLARRFPRLRDAQLRKAWEPLLEERAPRDLKGQVATVVGQGPIGREISRLLSAIGLHVIGVRTSVRPAPHCAETIAFESLPLVLPRTDWLVLACPLTDTTRRMIDATTFALLPAGAHLINVARGEVVVENDLIDALQQRRLAGAFLDVFELEPLSAESPLWTLPDVIITPHTSSHSIGYYTRVGELFLDNLVRWCKGEPLINDATRYQPPRSTT